MTVDKWPLSCCFERQYQTFIFPLLDPKNVWTHKIKFKYYFVYLACILVMKVLVACGRLELHEKFVGLMQENDFCNVINVFKYGAGEGWR